jgi:hypothetical protein
MNVDAFISLGGLAQAPVSLSPALADLMLLSPSVSNKDGAELRSPASFGSVPECVGISNTESPAHDETAHRSFTPPQASTTEHNSFAAPRT